MMRPHLDPFVKLALNLGGRPLRVRTICSGTDSPVFAFEMIQEVLHAELVERRLPATVIFEHVSVRRVEGLRPVEISRKS